MPHHQTFRNLHSKLLEVKAAPFKSAELIQSIQEVLVDKIRYIESRIRASKRSNNPDRAYEYQILLRKFKAIGDGIAFLFIDRWDIKPLARNHSPGFITGKAGFLHELRFLRKYGHMGPLLLADLTNCLRHGDLYGFKPNSRPFVMELKMSKSGGKGCRRQKARNGAVFEYLNTDVSEGSIFKGKKLLRAELSFPTVELLTPANGCLEEALNRGSSCHSPEDGLFYFAHSEGREQDVIESLTQKAHPSAELAIYDPVDVRIDTHDFMPLPLLIQNSDVFSKVMTGEIRAGVALDVAAIKRKFEAHNLIMQFLSDGDYFLELSDQTGFSIRVSRNFVGRVASEFLSVEWMISELAARFTKTLEAYHAQAV